MRYHSRASYNLGLRRRLSTNRKPHAYGLPAHIGRSKSGEGESAINPRRVLRMRRKFTNERMCKGVYLAVSTLLQDQQLGLKPEK